MSENGQSRRRAAPIIGRMTFDADAAYLALTTRDARFDGRLFVGVTSTGIYCRPVCRVRTPRARELPLLRATPRRPSPTASGPACAAAPSWRRACRWSIGRSQALAQQAARALDAGGA